MVSQSFKNLSHIPVFGFGAKTSRFCKKATPLFPLSRNIRNPFITNDKSSLEEAYYDCLASLEMSIPINLKPMLTSIKALGQYINNRLNTKAQTLPLYRNSMDTFYVVYVLTTGLIDDTKEVLSLLKDQTWKSLPVQIHFISLSPSHIAKEDQDTQTLAREFH